MFSARFPLVAAFPTSDAIAAVMPTSHRFRDADVVRRELGARPRCDGASARAGHRDARRTAGSASGSSSGSSSVFAGQTRYRRPQRRVRRNPITWATARSRVSAASRCTCTGLRRSRPWTPRRRTVRSRFRLRPRPLARAPSQPVLETAGDDPLNEEPVWPCRSRRTAAARLCVGGCLDTDRKLARTFVRSRPRPHCQFRCRLPTRRGSPKAASR